MKPKKGGRRRFLKKSAALAGLAAGSVRPASGQTEESEITVSQDPRARGRRSSFATSVRTVGQYGQETPLQDSMGIITPSALHYVAAHGSDPPQIDPQKHCLLIHGLVERPLIFTLEELQSLPSESHIYFLECGKNRIRTAQGGRAETVQQTHGYTSCSEWTGVRLSLLLQETGIQKEASWLVAEGAEPANYTKSIPLAKVRDDVLVAYGQNGEPVRPEQGYPFRLLVPGWKGLNSVKWLRRIKAVDQPYQAKSESTAYSRVMPDGKARWTQYEMEPKSVITRPSGGQRLPGPGFYEITGLAWSGWGVIRRVEVSTDGGRSWKDARLQDPVHPKAHTRFHFPWTWEGQEAMLQSRCTDEQGSVQPSLQELQQIWGVKLESWISPPEEQVNHPANFIQPWKVTSEGIVSNGLL